MLAAGYKPSGPYRGVKGAIYEGGHRVPFLVRWPKGVKAGTTSSTTICSTDFYATFADLLGVKDQIPENAAEDSFSFYPCLLGKDQPIRPFTIHHGGAGDFSIRKGNWKMLMTTKTGGGGVFPRKGIKTPSKVVQLYNLKDDICESQNLEDQYPEVIQALVNELAKALHDGRTTPGPKQKNDGWPYLDKATKQAFPQLSE